MILLFFGRQMYVCVHWIHCSQQLLISPRKFSHSIHPRRHLPKIRSSSFLSSLTCRGDAPDPSARALCCGEYLRKYVRKCLLRWVGLSIIYLRMNECNQWVCALSIIILYMYQRGLYNVLYVCIVHVYVSHRAMSVTEVLCGVLLGISEINCLKGKKTH